MTEFEKQANLCMTAEEIVGSEVRQALHSAFKTNGSEPTDAEKKQIDNVSRWIERRNNRVYTLLNSTHYKAPEEIITYFESVYYRGGLREALIDGGDLNRQERRKFGEAFLCIETEQ
mgnify:CR=1 FL=1